MTTTTRPARRLAAFAASAAAAVTFLPAAASAHPAAGPDQVAVLQADADAMVAAGVPGYVAQIGAGRDTRYVRAGVADRATGRPLSPADAFDIASITKPFGATVVLQLVAEHRLRLSDTVADLLPGAVPGGARITLRMLLNHTSGLFDYTGDDQWLAAVRQQPDRRWTYPELLAVALRHAPNFAPGTSWSYSNTGYVIVGMILERATGQPLARLFDRRIIRPLGLRHTYFAAGATFRAARHARGYRIGTADGRLTYPDATDVGLLSTGMDGGMVSTVGDLTRFFRALFGGRLLPPAQLAQMRRTVPEPGEPGRSYGLGLFRVETPCGVTWGHDGGSIGFASSALVTPDGRRSLVSFINAGIDPDADLDVLQRTILAPARQLIAQEACTLYGTPLPAAG